MRQLILMTKNNIVALLAEDDENDGTMIQLAIKRVDPDANVYMVSNGQEAIDYLQAKGEYADRRRYPFPNIIFTDLKMPKMTGFELLEWLQKHPECAVIPTIVLSSSDESRDVIRAYRSGANAYFTKPADFLHLVKLVRLNFDYWLEAKIPALRESKCNE